MGVVVIQVELPSPSRTVPLCALPRPLHGLKELCGSMFRQNRQEVAGWAQPAGTPPFGKCGGCFYSSSSHVPAGTTAEQTAQHGT